MIIMSSTSASTRPVGTFRRLWATYSRRNVDTPPVWADHSRRARIPDQGHGLALVVRVGIPCHTRRGYLTLGGDDAQPRSRNSRGETTPQAKPLMPSDPRRHRTRVRALLNELAITPGTRLAGPATRLRTDLALNRSAHHWVEGSWS